MLEVNGEIVYEKPKVLAVLQKSSSSQAGKLTLSVVPVKRPKHSSDPLSVQTNGNGRRMHKNVRDLRDKVRF